MKLKHQKIMIVGSAAITTAVSFSQIKLPSGDAAQFQYQKFKDHIEMSFSQTKKPEIVINKKDVPAELYRMYEVSLDCFSSHYYTSDQNFSDRWFYNRSQDLEKAGSCAEQIPGKILKARLLGVCDSLKRNIDFMKDLRSQWYAAYGLFMISLMTMWWHLNEKIGENTKEIYEYLKNGKKTPSEDNHIDWKISAFSLTSAIYLAWTDTIRAFGLSAFDTSMPFFWPTITCLGLSIVGLVGVFFSGEKKKDGGSGSAAIVSQENQEIGLDKATIEGKDG